MRLSQTSIPAQEKKKIQNLLTNTYSIGYTQNGSPLPATIAAAYHAMNKTAVVVGGNTGSTAAATSQGMLTSWTGRTVNASVFRAVTSSDGGSPFVYGVLVTVGDTGKIYSSGDAGASWAANTSSTTENLNDVIYSSRLSMWIAVGANGTIRTCAVGPSASPSTWSSQTAPEANTWTGIAESPTRLVAVASTGTNRVMTSTNGTSWSSVSAPASAWSTVTYSSDLNMFVAIGSGGEMYSSDGLTWIGAGGGGNTGAVWVPELGMFFGSHSYAFDGGNWLTYANSNHNGKIAYASHCGLVVCPTGGNTVGLRG